MAIILKVIVIGYVKEVLVIAGLEGASGKWLHLRLIMLTSGVNRQKESVDIDQKESG